MAENSKQHSDPKEDWESDENYQPNEDWDDVDWNDDDDDTDEIEDAMDECGQMQGGGCMLAGTEHCDFECPFSKQMYMNASRKRDINGRFCK